MSDDSLGELAIDMRRWVAAQYDDFSDIGLFAGRLEALAIDIEPRLLPHQHAVEGSMSWSEAEAGDTPLFSELMAERSGARSDWVLVDPAVAEVPVESAELPVTDEYVTKTGRVLTDDDIEGFAAEDAEPSE